MPCRVLDSRLFSLLALLTACGDGRDTSSGEDSAPGTGAESGSGGGATSATSSDAGSASSGGDGATGAESGSGEGPGDESGSAADDGAGDSGGVRLDVGSPGESGGTPGCDEAPGDCGCTGVDVLFVIDNSTSMGPAQMALANAFPRFADAMIAALPAGTDLHVGVTTTTFGFDPNGGTDGNCNAPAAVTAYTTPDAGANTYNGGQGRLLEHDGKRYYAIATDASAPEVEAFKQWFSQAALVGEAGSVVEYCAAAAGWVADPVNAPTNAGFIRDAGAVLVLFFISDEPDATPVTATDGLWTKLVAAKSACGGARCIVGGGALGTSTAAKMAYECLPVDALGTLFGELSEPAVVETFPGLFGGTVDAQPFVDALEGTLAGVIAKKCEEIPPVG